MGTEAVAGPGSPVITRCGCALKLPFPGVSIPRAPEWPDGPILQERGGQVPRGPVGPRLSPFPQDTTSGDSGAASTRRSPVPPPSHTALSRAQLRPLDRGQEMPQTPSTGAQERTAAT